jgi:hypothetical protein
MSGLLKQVDRAFWAVGDREASLTVLRWRHDAIVEYLSETFVIVAEQVGR